ncbi:hypothetical protein [Kordia sp.]|uniref:hypothetical protein n=1 Tax=Kordia sp. TaxID=1965332 RepID=UPI003D2656DA
MQRYRIFINAYNAKVPSLNKKVKEYNKRVLSYVKANQLQKQALISQTNFEAQLTNGIKNDLLPKIEFNDLVEKVNGEKPLLKMKKHIEVKQAQLDTFEIILWLYSQQLIKLRKQLQQLSSGVKMSFPKVEVTSTEVCNFTKEGEKRMLLKRDAIRRHVRRLKDAGVFVQYDFKGKSLPVNYYINGAIFVFRDNRRGFTDNQQVKPSSATKRLDFSVDTRIFTKEIIKKVGNVDNHSHEKEVNSFTAENSSKNKNTDKNTKEDKPQKVSNQNAGKLGSGENYPKNELSEYLRSQIHYRTALLQSLTAHHYDTYSYSTLNMNRRLEMEALKGAMSREEFRELLLQLFLKMSASIWKGMNVYYGSWHKAYIQIDDEYLRNPNGSIPRKETLLYMFGFLVYRIGRAKRFFKSKKQYIIHFPCIYFDPTRKLPSEGGFAYTLQWLKQYQKYKDLRAIRKQQAATKAGARRRQKTNEEKVRDKIKLYIKGKITLPQVYNYIETNKGIPSYFVSEVPRFIEIETNKEFDLYK